MTRQETINKAVAWELGIAEDPAHGYDQANRWGPNYDCSSVMISAWQAAGVPVKTNGASYTGNMYGVFLRCGFVDVTNKVNLATGAGLEKGDVLLNKKNHTELYIGGSKVVKASINERGGTTGGQSGDQTGREIYVGNYYNYPWDCVLRYMGGDPDEDEKPADSEPVTQPSTPVNPQLLPCYVKLPMLQRGDGGKGSPLEGYVTAMQGLLLVWGYELPKYGADGDFGGETQAALQRFQEDHGLYADGVCGNLTWAKLHGA